MKKAAALPPVRPSVGLELAFRRRLERLVDEMGRSVRYWVLAAYRGNAPEMAADASPASRLEVVVRRLTRKWRRRFDEAAPELAAYFAKAAAKRSDAALKRILKRSGFAVRFRMTREANDVLQATINEQVALIKSIPEQYLRQVQGAVMRSVQAGRGLDELAKALREQHGVTKRRAAGIARDQNNKATATVTRVRQQGLGITHAQWVHSYAGRHPRRSHLANNGKVYEIAEGWYDPEAKERTWPGVLINCRCVSRPIIPGLEGARFSPVAALQAKAEARAR